MTNVVTDRDTPGSLALALAEARLYWVEAGGIYRAEIENPLVEPQWSGTPDRVTNVAEICNDTGNYKTLMIVGNKSAGLGRRVSVWDRLEVNGTLVSHVVQIGSKFRLSGIGDAHANDDWLRMLDIHNKGYYGGFAAGRLWTAQAKLAGSDRRMKKNVRRIAGALGKVGKLRGVGFEWKESLSDRRAQLGLIAQEVEAVVPEVVETGPDQMKGIDYDGLVALLVEAVKDQQEHIEGLSRQLGQMRGQLGLEIPGVADPTG